MKTYSITPLHINGGKFNGTIYFLLDGHLLSMKFGTPMFNDYSAWKLDELKLATEPFAESTEGFTPLPMEPIVINEDEYKMIKLLFLDKILDTDEECEAFEAEVHALESSIPDCVHPYRYLEDPLLYSIETIEGLVHITYKPVHLTGSEWVGEEDDHRTLQGTWKNKQSLLHNQGFYNFLIPVMESLAANYNLDEKTADLFI